MDGPDPAFLAPPAPSGLVAGPRPTFSVIIAAYQAAAVAPAAVASALAQTEPPLELLVADDGSTDDLARALADFGKQVRLLQLPHRGAAAARNAAVEHSRGTFVAVLDADDRWQPHRLERVGQLLQTRPDLDLATTDAWFVVDGERRGRFYEANTFPTHDQATEILRRTFFFAHVAVRRARWLEVGGMAEELARGEDWDLQLRLLLSGSSAGCVREPLVDYTVHSHSLSADRYASMMARVELLTRAAATHRLTPGQQAALGAARARYLRRARAFRAEEALLSGSPDRRWAALEALRSQGIGRRERLRLLGAVAAPAWAGRRLRRRVADRGRLSDRQVP